MVADEIAFAGAARQAALVADGEVTARELCEAYLARIERLDPQLNAWRVVLAEQALAQADVADARRGTPDARPLDGVCVAIKDDTDLAGEVTAWGSSAHGPAVAEDAAAVAALRAAGATLLGKTNVPELTLFGSTETVTFGATRNPWNTSVTSGGSSGGTGAAVASGMCAVGLGTDGLGSVRIPAAWCGLIGHKPTRGLTSIEPHTDGWNGLAVVGPLARSVRDAALFLDATAVAGADGHVASFVDAAASANADRLRIAVSTAVPGGLPIRAGLEQREVLERTVDLLRDLGHQVVPRDPDLHPLLASDALVRATRGLVDDVDALAHPERLERRTRDMARAGRLIPRRVLRAARAREEAYGRIARLFDDVDVLLYPTVGGPPFEVGRFQLTGALATRAQESLRLPYCATWNVTGQPATTVPSGFDREGLPLSVQLVGPRGADARLLALAAQLEEARPWADARPAVS